MVPFAAVSQNLVVNGSFGEGTAGWDSLLVNSPAQATKTVSDSMYHIAISSAGTEAWHIQLKQKGIDLDSGEVYRFSFEARAAAARVIDASVGMDNGPYTLYTPANQTRFTLGTEARKFEVFFRMNHASDTNARVQFNCALAAVDIFISSVSLEKIAGPLLMMASPAGGETWASATKQGIMWICAGIDSVDLAYSPDAGLTWNAITTVAGNIGYYSWTIPSQSSPWCLVRVADAAGSGLGDTSALPFEIGTYFNLVRNGSFADSLGGSWNTLGVYGTASAQGSVANGAFVITIQTPGTERWNVQFTQQGIPLVEGELYVFSFSAWATESRSLLANIGQAGGAYESYIGDTTKGVVTLSTTPQTYRIEFVMSKPSDTNARIEFNTGMAAGTVYLDNVTLLRKRVQRNRWNPAGNGRAPGGQLTFRLYSGIRYGTHTVALSGTPLQARIFNPQGQVIRTLRVTQGSVAWDGRSDFGRAQAPGVYLVRVISTSGSGSLRFFLPPR